ncbi:hypothetical protein D3C76_1531980 [compost metagenome]
MPRVPKSTTQAMAMATCSLRPLTRPALARIAAAPQMAWPAPIRMAVSRSRRRTLVPSQIARLMVERMSSASVTKACTPSAWTCWMVRRRP